MAPPPRYERLDTERPNPASRALDRLAPLAVARLMNREDARAVRAVRRVLPAVAAAVDRIVTALRAGGRLFFVGAGTSGRLGVLEAAECPPTFGTPPSLVQAIIAGGRRAVFRSREGAEDDRAAARAAIARRVRGGDVVVGLSASGVTPYVRAALGEARRRGAATVAVVCNPAAARGVTADVVIAPAPGPEVVAGSTRLKAGTATKLVLNMLTTAAMARLGRVWGNRMVDVQPRSRKLRARAVRLVAELGGVPVERARPALAAARGRVRVAIVVARAGCTPAVAARALARTGGALDRAVAEARRAADGGNRARRGARAPGRPVRRARARRSPPGGPGSGRAGSRSRTPRWPGARARGRAGRSPGRSAAAAGARRRGGGRVPRR
jgi:N-acetylmuramic acid 6-phosphate etherase